MWSKPSEQNIASWELKKLGCLACWLVNGGFLDNLKQWLTCFQDFPWSNQINSCFQFLCTKWTVWKSIKDTLKLGTKDLSEVKVNDFRISHLDYFCCNKNCGNILYLGAYTSIVTFWKKQLSWVNYVCIFQRIRKLNFKHHVIFHFILVSTFSSSLCPVAGFHDRISLVLEISALIM